MTPPIFSAFNAWVAAEPLQRLRPSLFSAPSINRGQLRIAWRLPSSGRAQYSQLADTCNTRVAGSRPIPSAREGPVEGTLPVWVCPGFLAGCCSAGCYSDCGMRILRCLRIGEILLQCPAHLPPTAAASWRIWTALLILPSGPSPFQCCWRTVGLVCITVTSEACRMFCQFVAAIVDFPSVFPLSPE